ncbi:hypothetical protein ABIF07_001637 [Bradyrhizobium elkanii]
MQSTLKDADPHDIFAIEPSFAPVRPDNAAAPAGRAAPGQREPYFGPSLAPSSAPPAAAVASVPPVTPMSVAPEPPAEPAYSAPSHDGRLDDIRLDRAPRPTSKWAIRAFWFCFAIAGAMGTAAWQHYGDRAKQIAAEWAPQITQLTSLIPGKSVSASDQASAPAAQAATTDQPAAEAAPAYSATGRRHGRARRSRAGASPCRGTGSRSSPGCARYRGGTSRSGTRPDAVAAIDGPRSHVDGTADRAAEDQHRSAQGQPGSVGTARREDDRDQGRRAAAGRSAAPARRGHATGGAACRRCAATGAPTCAGLHPAASTAGISSAAAGSRRRPPGGCGTAAGAAAVLGC